MPADPHATEHLPRGVGAPRALTAGRAPEGTPLYVHLPFCAAKCPYCDFFSVAALGHDLEGMVEAILREASIRAPRRPTTVFLGGGTPSLLPAHLLRRLLDGLDEVTGFRGSAREVTAECNPESLDLAKARALLELGVGRLSIGFQSLHDEVLALLGRVHGAEDSFRAYDAARRAGVADVNVDLIYSLPDQEVSTWSADLARVVALGPDHVAAYNLAFEQDTPFRRWLEEGRLRRNPEERELELFWTTRRQLAGAKMEAYEVSNFSLEGYQCRHNINYWDNGPYAGLGPSAVSCWSGERRGNVRSVGEYQRRLGGGLDAATWCETLPPLDRLGETWWLGLRTTRGVDPAAALRTAGLDPSEEDPAKGVAVGLVEQGLLERTEGRLRLTPRGLPVADAVAAEFLGLARGGSGRPA